MNIEDPKHPAWHGTSVAPTINAIRLGWKEIDGFSDWVYYWNERCESLEQAVGLLHAIPLNDPRAVRLLLAVAQAHDVRVRERDQNHQCRPGQCQLAHVADVAQRILCFRVLKTNRDEVLVQHGNAWWGPVHMDPDLLTIVLDWLCASWLVLQHSTDTWESARGFLKALIERSERGAREEKKLGEIIRATEHRLYLAALHYDVAFSVDDDAALAAVRAIALGKDHWGNIVGSLEEGLLRGSIYGKAAALALVAEAKKRADAEEEKRAGVKVDR